MKCADCVFYREDPMKYREGIGECFYSPPMQQFLRPHTKKDDFCAQFVRRLSNDLKSEFDLVRGQLVAHQQTTKPVDDLPTEPKQDSTKITQDSLSLREERFYRFLHTPYFKNLPTE